MILITKTPAQMRSEPPIPIKKPPKRPPISWITSHKRGKAKTRINSAIKANAMNFSTLPIFSFLLLRGKNTNGLSQNVAQAVKYLFFFYQGRGFSFFGIMPTPYFVRPLCLRMSLSRYGLASLKVSLSS